MEKSWIVYGPQGTGKTLHASAICKALGLDPKRTIDEWDGRQCSFKPAGTLHLTTHLPAWAEGSRRALSIEQALARVPGLAAPPRCPRCGSGVIHQGDVTRCTRCSWLTRTERAIEAADSDRCN